MPTATWSVISYIYNHVGQPVELGADDGAVLVPLALALVRQDVALDELLALRPLTEEARQAVLSLHLRRQNTCNRQQ